MANNGRAVTNISFREKAIELVNKLKGNSNAALAPYVDDFEQLNDETFNAYMAKIIEAAGEGGGGGDSSVIVYNFTMVDEGEIAPIDSTTPEDIFDDFSNDKVVFIKINEMPGIFQVVTASYYDEKDRYYILAGGSVFEGADSLVCGYDDGWFFSMSKIDSLPSTDNKDRGKALVCEGEDDWRTRTITQARMTRHIINVLGNIQTSIGSQGENLTQQQLLSLNYYINELVTPYELDSCIGNGFVDILSNITISFTESEDVKGFPIVCYAGGYNVEETLAQQMLGPEALNAPNYNNGEAWIAVITPCNYDMSKKVFLFIYRTTSDTWGTVVSDTIPT